jgi:hypothetical protein
VPDLSKRLASKPGNTEVVNWAPLLANLQPNANLKPMPTAMSVKIMGICNALFPEWSHGR